MNKMMTRNKKTLGLKPSIFNSVEVLFCPTKRSLVWLPLATYK